MTRDEHRAKCIEAVAIAWLRRRGYKNLDKIPDWMMRQTIEEQTVAIDSLHVIARVVPVETTRDMVNASYEKERDLFGPTARGLKHSVIFEVMSAAGDLTNPEQKP